MLEQRDVEIFKNMLNAVLEDQLKKTEVAILEKVDDRLEKTETSILEKVDDRLEKTEASILEKVDDRLEKAEASILEKVDDRLEKIEISLLNKVDIQLRQSENMILSEMECTRTILEKQIERIRQNMDELNQYYRIAKLENDNTELLLDRINELSKRVEELERRAVWKVM
ncbi:MAG: hypothetical protein K2N24_08045 [Lachnospiraceae bacterium]|nr:hypothetical protein [Lachnospiraceae bacterium]